MSPTSSYVVHRSLRGRYVRQRSTRVIRQRLLGLFDLLGNRFTIDDLDADENKFKGDEFELLTAISFPKLRKVCLEKNSLSTDECRFLAGANWPVEELFLSIRELR